MFSSRARPGWAEELARLTDLLRDLPPAATLDVACGTGYLTRFLPGPVTAIDLAPSMLRIARTRTAGAVLAADALRIPFRDYSFDRVFTAHFLGHLPAEEKARFLAEAGRVGAELVVVDSAPRPDRPPEHWEERVLTDGSRHQVFKRYLSAEQLAGEIGGQPLFCGSWFAVARAGGTS